LQPDGIKKLFGRLFSVFVEGAFMFLIVICVSINQWWAAKADAEGAACDTFCARAVEGAQGIHDEVSYVAQQARPLQPGDVEFEEPLL